MLKALIKSGLTKSLFFFLIYGRAIHPNSAAKAFVLIKRKNSDCDYCHGYCHVVVEVLVFSTRRNRL